MPAYDLHPWDDAGVANEPLGEAGAESGPGPFTITMDEDDPDDSPGHLLGNDRITAIAHTSGLVEAYDWSRGLRCLNRTRYLGHAGGGYVQVMVGEQVAVTAALSGGACALKRVRFGAGYLEKTSEWEGLRIDERVEAPHGDDPVLLHTVTVTNAGATAIEAHVAACWAANVHPVIAIPVLPKRFIRAVARWRARFMRRFTVLPKWDDSLCCRSAHYRPPWRAPRPAKRTFRDWHPKPVFLACLDGGAQPTTPDLTAWNIAPMVEEAFRRDPSVPLWLGQSITLAPGESRTFRFLFGTASASEIGPLVDRWRTAQPERRPCVDFDGEGIPDWLGREIAWHAAYLQAGVCYMDYFGAPIIDQGSAYSFLQGATGAPRDFALFILPMVYLRSDLAKDMLRFLLRSQDAKKGKFPYAFTGHGVTSGAGAHSMSSDLDLFFFWALSEYLNATRDYAFLDEMEPYYPREKGAQGTVLEHVRAAFRHLTTSVGTGRNGLLRCGTGDWNDVLCGFSWLPPVTALRGESTLNAGLATVVLPAMAGAVERAAPELAEDMRALARQQAAALETQWTGGWVARGTLGYLGKRLGVDRLFLDTQAFGVIGGVWTGERRKRLFENIRSRCVMPMKAGARCLDPPYRAMHLKPGVDTNGGDWAAINSWVAWAWSLEDPRAAWDFFLRTTMAARAEAYPGTWYGVWSGPDAFNGCDHPEPGETSNFVFTPMAEFPVFNMNRHSGPLLDVIKLAGITADGDGITIDPKLPTDWFHLGLGLHDITYHEGRAIGVYRPKRETRVRFTVRPPASVTAPPHRHRQHEASDAPNRWGGPRGV
ncbi:GH36-type glycosyl hydrolase domain-containing protein [Roseovarius pacificus]|uniref:GH36-type glycosyl hydrolase domain-containing protein n=1 Tax=Roseovarius pacificus TaxID=337701 RepID=UPI002A18A761|nr:hypothetical protein [Roseovarius pacificus]